MDIKTLEPKFNNILNNHQLKSTNVYIVESVKHWANTQGLKEDNPFLLAMTLCRNNSDIWDIAIKSKINSEEAKGVTSGMDIRGFKHYKELEKDLEKFIFHTFLHEIAHIKGVKNELEADNWAYDELQKL
ncbi:MAG: hypothetical protein ABH812_01165 [bacterium]